MDQQDWVAGLSDEDRSFVRRFVLASGSLKEMAQIYRVSYPTVRLRLDRLIRKIETLEQHRDDGPFEQAIRLAHAEGQIDIATLKTLLAAHRKELEHTSHDDEQPRSSRCCDR